MKSNTIIPSRQAINTEADFCMPGEWSKGVSIEKNPYSSILVDITSRCNMRCNFCYYQERHPRDMDLDSFRYFCENLPSPIIMKLAGGEPTLHPHLEQFIRIAMANRHRVYICSNGLRYRDPELLNSLNSLTQGKQTFGLGITMDGGVTHAEAYRLINGRDCLKEKVEAFEALVSSAATRVCITAIIVRNFNESIIPELLDLANRNSRVVRYIHLRNAGRIGDFIETEPYTLEDLKSLTANYFTAEQMEPGCLGEVHCPPESKRNCCYRFRPTSRLQISLVEFASERSSKCPKRGRITVDCDKIYPLFQSIREAM